jgi:hypothetical protein
MTKDELIEALQPFVGDIQITVGGWFPQVFYHPATDESPAFLNLEDEHYQPDNDDGGPDRFRPGRPVYRQASTHSKWRKNDV